MRTTRLVQAALAAATLLAGPGTGWAEDPPKPSTVYVYNGVGDRYDHIAQGIIWRQIGLLDASGKPVQTTTDPKTGEMRDSGGRLVAYAIFDSGGKVIGYRSADRTKACYDVSSGATTAQAWNDVAGGGTVHIIKHGASQGGIRGGGIRLDNGSVFPGFRREGAQGGGTGVPYSDGPTSPPNDPYGLPAREGASVNMGLNSCWSDRDPDGDGPGKSVSSTAKDVPGVASTSGQQDTATLKCVLLLLGTKTQKAAAWRKLVAAAEKAGITGGANEQENVLLWIASLALLDQWKEVEKVIKGTGAKISEIRYHKPTIPWPEKSAMQVTEEEEEADVVHACPCQISPPESGTVTYEYDVPPVDLAAKVTVGPGDLVGPTTFHMIKLPGPPGKLPRLTCLATGVFDFRHMGVEPALAGPVDYHLATNLTPGPDIAPYFFDGTNWTPITTYHWEGQDLVASINRVGIMAGLKTVQPLQVPLSATNMLVDGTWVQLNPVSITADSHDFAGRMYVQQPDRACGIQVRCLPGAPPLVRDTVVQVMGCLETIAGERVMADAMLSAPMGLWPNPPLGMNNPTVGGDWAGLYGAGIDGCSGLNNVGLLVRTAGKVTGVGSDYFIIDDGGVPGGLRVSTAGLMPGNVISPPSPNSHLAITGLSSVREVGETSERLLRPRRQDDVRVVGP